MTISSVIWDWNGTLFNDTAISMEAVNRLLVRHGRAPISTDCYREAVCTPIFPFYTKVFGEPVPDGIMEDYFTEYTRLLPQAELTDGVMEVLCEFQRRGVQQFVLSSFEQQFLLRAMQPFAIESFFEAIGGASNFEGSSKSDRARKLMETHRLSAEQTLMIGDLSDDWETAKDIGASCALLSSGHHGRARLERAGAPVIDDVRTVLTW